MFYSTGIKHILYGYIKGNWKMKMRQFEQNVPCSTSAAPPDSSVWSYCYIITATPTMLVVRRRLRDIGDTSKKTEHCYIYIFYFHLFIQFLYSLSPKDSSPIHSWPFNTPSLSLRIPLSLTLSLVYITIEVYYYC